MKNNSPLEIIDKTTNICYFNVMPKRFVKETLTIKKYIINKNVIEAVLDREYVSEMVKSPSHLIFLSVLIHSQKMLYIYLCHYFNFKYDPNEEEKLKIWPTWMEINLPKLITNEKDIIHKIHVDNIECVKDKQYIATINIQVSDRIWMKARSNIYLL